MALEFNADKQLIKSTDLNIKGSESVRIDLGSSADEKVAIFGTLTSDADSLVRIGINTLNPIYELDVEGAIRTTTSIISDTARIANLDIDTIINPALNLRAPVLNSFADPNTGEIFFPRSATPAFDDDSDKIATTNFVYNIATNDVGGRIYVSAQIGSDTFDGRSATKPVRSIKRATQLAALTGDKETLIIAGGDYLEDNPISLPDLCSVVGDNIRLCIIRPRNAGKHMFKASNENYVTGITFRDQVDDTNTATKTWGYAYVFDDKQRFYYPKTLGGQFGRTFELGHKIAAPQKWQLTFTSNGGGVLLVPGLVLTNTSTSGTGVISEVNFDLNTEQTGTVVIDNITGTIESIGAVYQYDANDPVVTYDLSVSGAELLTPDAQVVKHQTTHVSYGIDSVTYDPDNYPNGLIFNLPTSPATYHDYEVGQYVEISNLPDTGVYADLSRFNGRQYISHRIETDDGFSTKFVVFKDTPTDLIALGAPGGTFGVSSFAATVTSADHYVVFSLNNSPRKFEESTKSPNRYLDAVDLIDKNKEGIAAEALRRTKAEYTSLVVPDETQCKTDVQHIVDAINYDLTWGGNAATKEAAENYYTGGALDHITDQLKETTYAFEQARDLSIQAMRNQLTYVDYSSTGVFTRPAGYTGTYVSATWDNEKFIAVGTGGAIHTSSDGTTWTAETSGTSNQLNDIIWNKWAVGERGVPEYIAVGLGGVILHSNNRVNWYSKTSGVSTELRAIAYNGNTYVVVGAAGTVITSQNVTSWVSRTSGTTETLLDVIYNDDVNKFIAVGTAGIILESGDGITWTPQESGTSQDLYGITWSEGRTIITGNVGTLLISDDGGLTWETNLVTTNVEADRYQDASDLILKNKKLIAAQSVYNYTTANSFTVPTGNQNCIDDVVDVLEAIAFDLRHGGNAKSYDAASYYVGTTHVDGEETETVGIINEARDLAKQAMRNISITLSYLTDNTYVSGLESQFQTGEQFFKPDISLDGSDPATACANVASSIDTLASIITTAVTNDNLTHATRTVPTGTFDQAVREVSHDGNRFWASGSGGGTQKIYVSEDRGRTWVEAYSGTGSQHYVLAFSYDIGIVAGDNGNDFIFDSVGTEFDASIGITPYQDETISNTYDSNRFFACDNVANSLFTLWNIIIDRINGRTLPATTFASSSYVDSNNKFFNVGHAWDDLPIIEVSPYIFNSSVISFLGGGGAEIDGAKVATPNVRRPNLPPQGKSMVAAAFTIISFGGTGYRVINDGYTQLVSVFCIFTQDGALVETGGYASLTNSASNFGTFSLRASGVREEAYSFDKGVVDNITFNDIGVPIFRVENLGSPPLEHYIIQPGGFELQVTPGDQNPRYFIEETITSTTLAPITAEILANRAMEVRGNFNRYTDAAVLLENNARYIAEEAYFSTAATSSNVFDQNRDKCIRDVEEIVKAWAQDIKYDANDATWDAAKLYVSGNVIQHVAGYEAATKEVIDTATTLAKKAINNLLQRKGTTAQTADYYVAEWTDEFPYVDTAVIHDVSSPVGQQGTETDHYVSNDCANVQSAIQTLSDLFDEIIDNPAVTSPLPSTAERDNGFFTINAFNKDKLVNHPIDLKRPSICNSSSHTWEFSGSGNDYNALPQNGGKRGSENTKDFEQVSQNNGRVYASGTDELGDFKIGYFAKVENRTGNITFGGTVEISEVSFLKITGNDVVITGFSPDNTLGALELGGPGAKDELLPTQKSVKDYISNQLGIYIGRTYSTVPTPNALVQLDGSGRINIDQLPALRPFNIFTVITEADRLALEGPLAGDIVIETASQNFQISSTAVNTTTDEITIVNHELTTSDVVTYFQGTSTIGGLNDSVEYYAIVIDNNTVQLALSVTEAVSGTQIDLTSQGSGTHIFETQGIPISYILNNDLESQILEFEPDVNHTFSNGDITLATPGGGQGQVTNYLVGIVKQVIINNGGTGYSSGDTVTFSTPSGGVAATGTLTVNSGVITAVTLSSGGSNYFTAPSSAAGTITINTSTGSNATLTSIIRSRLSINILNNVKTEVTDNINDQDLPANNITLIDVINTSGFNVDNWIQLTSSTIDSSFVTSGVISVARLASISPNYPASSLSYLRGDSRFAPAVSSIRQTAGSPIILGSNNSASDYIAQILIENGGEGYTVGTYTDTELLGGNSGAEGLKGTIYVANNTVAEVTITDGGQGYTDDVRVIFKDGFTDPNAEEFPILPSIKAKAEVFGGAITKVYILDGGANLGGTPVVEFDGTGVDAAATCVVRNGAIRTITITDGGVNYTADFTITPNPAIIGISPTTAAVLKADLASIPKIFNDTFIDINRVDGLTIAADPFSNLGVVRVRKSQFNFFSNGGIELKTGEGSGLDADTLDLKDSTFFTNASNLNAGTVPSGRLNGETYQITNTGSSSSSGLITPTSATSSIFAPENYGESLRLQLKRNDQGYADTNEHLLDGGLYHSLITTRRAGSSTDFAFGAVSQIAQTDNNNLWIRNSGPNHVASIAITQTGSGYVNGTYTNVPLGGGEGSGLRATIIVNGGSITSVTIKDRGWGYNVDGGATTTFQATLPEDIFGTQNTRQITTPAILTATLAFLGSGNSTGNQWSSWRKIWHDGNDGIDSGLDADLFRGYDLRWFKNLYNSNENTILNSNLPVQMEEHSFNKEIRVSVPSPLFQTNNGGHYDIYIEGYNLTDEVINSLDVDGVTPETQLNLYTANNVAEGRVRVVARRINLDPANYLTGTQYVETNTEWTSGASGYNRNDRIVYGNNIYRIANENTGNYTSGTVAPVHQSGTVTATGGTAEYEFERKVDNPWTVLTVELINGNINETIKNIGTASAPAEYYPISGFGLTAVETYSRRKARIGSDSTGTAFLELGNVVESTSPYIDFNSSGNNVNYDVRLIASGGSSTVGTGTLNAQANNLQVNGNNVWHGGNITFASGSSGTAPALTYDTAANNKGVIRTADGDFGGRYIVASSGFIGTATGNLPLTGGTLTGNVTFTQDQTGVVWSRNSDGASIKFYNTGDGDTNSRLEFNTLDNGNEYFRWTHTSDTTRELMRLQGNGTIDNTILTLTGKARFDLPANQTNGIIINGANGGYSSIEHRYNDGIIGYRLSYVQQNGHYGSGTLAGDVVDRVDGSGRWIFSRSGNTPALIIDQNSNVALNQSNTNTSYKLYVNGAFGAVSKSFVIPHPTKENHELRYGSLEGPEHGVYVRGKVTDGVIELPDYWTALVDEDTITVQLTAIGDSGNRWVIDVADNKITTGGGAAFYFVQAERKDIDKLEVEVELPVVKEEEE